MNRTHLSAFAAVAETGSFTKGAEKLMVSQPAVSLQVGELEAALKTPLFDRLPRGVRLTAAGELLLAHARRIASAEFEAESAIANLLGLKGGRLVLGASLTIGSYLLPQILAQFRRKHPEIELDLQIANTHQIERMLSNDQLDLAFTEGLISEQDERAQVIAHDRLVPIAHPKHPIFHQKRVTAASLGRQGLIFRESGSGTREVIEAALARRGISVKPIMSLGSTEAIKRAVQAGMGLAIVSELSIDVEVAARTLRVLPISDLIIQRPLTLSRPQAKSDSPAATEFLRMLRAALN